MREDASAVVVDDVERATRVARRSVGLVHRFAAASTACFQVIDGIPEAAGSARHPATGWSVTATTYLVDDWKITAGQFFEDWTMGPIVKHRPGPHAARPVVVGADSSRVHRESPARQ